MMKGTYCVRRVVCFGEALGVWLQQEAGPCRTVSPETPLTFVLLVFSTGGNGIMVHKSRLGQNVIIACCVYDLQSTLFGETMVYARVLCSTVGV